MRFEWKVAPSGAGQGVNLFQAVPAPAAPAIRLTAPVAPPAVAVPVAPAKPAAPAAPTKPAAPSKPTAESSPEKINVNALLEKAMQLKGKVDSGDLDLAKLQELLKTLKPLELKVEVDDPNATPKPTKTKKPEGPGM
jgi:hypothetical protein